MSQAVDRFVQQSEARFLEELKEFIRIPSISTLPEHDGDVQRAAHFVAESMKTAGLENIEIIPTAKHPLVYADWLNAPGKPTVLCYGHYDVQPPDPVELWHTPPFEPTIRNGNLYARGAVDDKGQSYMHLKAIEALFAAHGKLPVNLKFIVEGEEEIGGASIAKFVAENPAKLKADVALVSDTAMYAEGIPTLCIGFARPDVHRSRVPRSGAGSAFRVVWRSGAKPDFWTDRIARKSEKRRWHRPDPGLL